MKKKLTKYFVSILYVMEYVWVRCGVWRKRILTLLSEIFYLNLKVVDINQDYTLWIIK